MTEDCRSQLLQFLREEGNVLPIAIRLGPVCRLEKRYERFDARGEGLGRPLLMLTVDARRAAESARLLGTTTLPGPDGAIYVLEAETAATFSDGKRIDRYIGVGTGLYRIRPERGYVYRLADGSYVSAPTEAGLRRKIIKLARPSEAA